MSRFSFTTARNCFGLCGLYVVVRTSQGSQREQRIFDIMGIKCYLICSNDIHIDDRWCIDYNA